MDPDARSEVAREALGVGHVVLMGEQDVPDAAARLQLPEKRRGEPRRVDEQVAPRTHDEERVGPEGIGGVEPAVRHPVLELLGEEAIGLHVRPLDADGRGRAGHEGARGRAELVRGGGLLAHRGLAEEAAVEDGGRELPAGVAVDAGRVHEPGTGGVGGVTAARIGHLVGLSPLSAVRPGATWRRRAM